MSETVIFEHSHEKDALGDHKWQLFDELDSKHTYSELLQRVVDHTANLERNPVPSDTYEICELCKELEAMKEGKTKQLLEAIDHVRYFDGHEGEKPKKIPTIRMKPSVHHVVMQDCVVNKHYTVKLELTNKSHLKSSWRIINPSQDRQSVFFACHPQHGILEGGKHSPLSMELVLLDAREFHRLVVVEATFGNGNYRTYSAILISTDTASYPQGAVVSDDVDLGDVDLDACYWHISHSDLRHKGSQLGSSLSMTSLSSLGSSTSLNMSSGSIGSNSAIASQGSSPTSAGAQPLLLMTSSSPQSAISPWHLYGVNIAVKKLSLTSKADRDEFWHEVNVMSSLRHPHLVNLIGASLYADEGFLVTRLFRNGDLRTFLAHRESNREHKTFSAKLTMALGISKAVKVVHSFDRLHRAISASNVFLTDEFDVKLGSAQLKLHSSITSSNEEPTGDEAPEVAISRSFSEAADVYSFGLLLWELATEIRPQRTIEEISSGVVPAIPSEVEAYLKEEGGNIAGDFLNLIRSCLAMDANNRINSRKLVREMVKLHEAAVLKPEEKPAAVKRRRTKERGLGGRTIQSSDTGEESSHVVSSPRRRHSPKKSSHSKASVEEGPSSPRKRKDRPTSPAAIHFEATDSSAISPSSNSGGFSEESAPNRVSIGEVVELSPRERKPSKKSKQKA